MCLLKLSLILQSDSLSCIAWLVITEKPITGNTNDYHENKRNINRLIIRQLNINSLSNKYESLVQQITGNIDILMVSETKLDNSFPVSQFLIDGYTSPFRIDRDNNGGGIMLFVREYIPCKHLSVEIIPWKVFM